MRACANVVWGGGSRNRNRLLPILILLQVPKLGKPDFGRGKMTPRPYAIALERIWPGAFCSPRPRDPTARANGHAILALSCGRGRRQGGDSATGWLEGLKYDVCGFILLSTCANKI